MRNRILATAIFMASSFALCARAGSIEIKLGTTIERTWQQVKADHFAYGPKQDYDARSGETHVYLPYGNKPELYDDVHGTLTDVTAKSLALFHSAAGDSNATLTYKLHFDQRIGTLRFKAGWAEVGLRDDTVAGVEYSEDGLQWRTIREIKGADKPNGIVEPLVKDFKATDLNTDMLYIRLYSRDPSNPENSGPGRWLQVRMSGDPSWRDIATTFFSNQLQVWVAPVKPGTPLRAISSRLPAQKFVLPAARIQSSDARHDDASPWGMASSSEWSSEYPRFNPLLKDAGVRWLRLFPEWHVIEPKQGAWNWKQSDALAADAQANGLHLLGVCAYLAPWASADGGTRKFPLKNIQYWRDYVSGVVARYKNDVQYWEVWNEFNGSFGESNNKVHDYGELAVTAYDAAKKVDPSAKVGLSVANFDVGFLDAVIKAGAADHFDFICVHPYENLGAVAEGGEVGYLSLVGNLRRMLAANKQRSDIPLWITEVGFPVPIKPDVEADRRQAEMLVKGYVLSLAQGFERIFWFEARGPAYGNGTDLGIIRSDWTKRPAYEALRTMTGLLGPEPRYLGWLNLGEGGFGFVFKGPAGDVLTAWAPAGTQQSKQPHAVKFNVDVTQTELAGRQSSLARGTELVLTPTPVFISGLPAELVAQARANVGKRYPWGGDYANAQVVTCRLGAANVDDGLTQFSPKTTVVVNELTASYRRADFDNRTLNGEGRYVYFRVDPQFVPFGTHELRITIVAKRLAADKSAGLKLTYESSKGYHDAPGWWTIPEDDAWHEHTWTLGDTNFVGQWGWNFRFDSNGSANAFSIKEVRVKKPTSVAQ